jgi:ABC-type Fe3+ transport system substrate-binding protein
MNGSSNRHRKRAGLRQIGLLGVFAGALACAPAAAPPAAPAPAPAPAGAAAPAASQPASAQAEQSPVLRALIDGARQEGALNLVWSDNLLGGPAGAQQLQDTLNRKYGLNLAVTYTPGPAGPTTGARVAQEVAAGQRSHTDIHMFVDASIVSAFQPASWREYVPELPADAVFYDGRAVGIITQLPGVSYNRELVPADRVPHSLYDLLDPWWQGKLAAPPYAYTIQFLALDEFLGYERTMDFVRKYSTQLGGLIRCGESQRLATGEFVAQALDCGEYQVRRAQRQGMPLEHVVPSEGGALKYYTAGVPVTSPHPNAAKLLISFLMTHEGQEFLWNAEGADNHKVPSSHMAAVTKGYADRGAKFLDAIDLEQKYPIVAQYAKEIEDILQQGAKP